MKTIFTICLLALGSLIFMSSCHTVEDRDHRDRHNHRDDRESSTTTTTEETTTRIPGSSTVETQTFRSN